MSAGLMDCLAHIQTLLPPSELPFAERVLEQNVSHENHLIFMRMTEHHTSSFATRSATDWAIHP